MADSTTDARAASDLAPPAAETEARRERTAKRLEGARKSRKSIRAERGGGGEDALEAVKAELRTNMKRRANERREWESGDRSASLNSADILNELREERDDQILSAVLGVYEEED